ncbi:MAG: beta strand repeat-containing protein, partial [Rhodospirillales bacterium]
GTGDTIIRDDGYSRTLNFANTTLTGIAEIDAGGGDDTITTSNLNAASYRGGSGNDTFNSGSQDATFLYAGTNNGNDSFATNGAGHSVAKAETAGTVIGVAGFNNGVDAIEGTGDTIIRDDGYSRTLDFSNTLITGVQEIDAGGGDDTVTTSNLSALAIRGGSGNDTFHSGAADVTFLYSGANNGNDSFATNGAGHSVAKAEGAGTVIGVAGFNNGVDAIEGAGDTIIRDDGYSRTLDFANTALSGIGEIDAGGGDDTVTTSNTVAGIYRGGSGNDTFHSGAADVTFLYSGVSNGNDSFATNGAGHSVAKAEGAGTVIGVAGFNNGVDAIEGTGDTVVRDDGYSRTLNFADTEISGVAEIDAGGGDDTITTSDHDAMSYRGGSGNDTFHSGAADATFLYSGVSNGNDSFVTNGGGNSVAVAEGAGTVIGIAGFNNGIDAFQGAGDTVIRDDGYSRTLNFANTRLSGISEVDAGGGDDTITTSNIDAASYRGGSGNDTFNSGAADATFLYAGTGNGNDTFSTNGGGHSVAKAEGAGTVIGVNGYNGGVDAFEGAGDTVIQDSGYSHILNFSSTSMNGIALVDAGGGDDTIVTATGTGLTYSGGSGNDTFVLTAHMGAVNDWLKGDSGTDTIDLTQFAGDWTVELADGGSFSNKDAPNAGLFTDTSGSIVFADGSTATFEGIENFKW